MTDNPPRSRRYRRPLLLALGTVLAAVAWSQYWVGTGRVVTVEDGRLYRSAALSPDRLLALCRERRITTVIDLRKPGEDNRAEQQRVEAAGLKYVALPTGQVPAPDTVTRFLALMDTRRDDAVLLHCTHGVGRTGVFSAIYRMEYQGWSNRAAIAEAVVISGFGSFGPGNSKAAFLWNYTPRRAAGGPR